MHNGRLLNNTDSVRSEAGPIFDYGLINGGDGVRLPLVVRQALCRESRLLRYDCQKRLSSNRVCHLFLSFSAVLQWRVVVLTFVLRNIFFFALPPLAAFLVTFCCTCRQVVSEAGNYAVAPAACRR